MTASEFQNHVLPLRDKLYSFAWKFLLNAEDARDVVQDVMMKIWEEGKEPAEYRSMEAWCMTLTRNRALDRIKRKNFREGSLDYDVLIEPQFSDAPINDAKEALNYVKELLKDLPVIQREIIELRDFGDLSYEEIAAELQIDINQVKVYLHRARKFVQEGLNKIMQYGLSANK